MVWCAPHDPIPTLQWLALLAVIQPDVWILLVVSILLSTCVIYAIAKRSPIERNSYKDPGLIFQNILIMSVNFSVNLLPKTVRVRLVIAMILFLAFSYNSAYQTDLVSILAQDNKFEEKYVSVNDIYRYNLTTYFTANTERFFQDDTLASRTILSKYVSCEVKNYELCVKQVMVEKKAAVCFPKTFLEYMIKIYTTNANPKVLQCFMSEPVVTFPLNFVMFKGIWIYERVNLLLNRILASGLIEKWGRIPKYLHRKDHSLDDFGLDDPDADGTKTLSFHNLKFVFVFMVFGHIVASFVFVVEITYDRYKNKK
ncbi:uncharacterized protein LOC132704907 [Cylas formicarius]|uniref:uncharacterized protein LOC132704907 n=1 Tax=Cylas formicarius TaxID=197179 RepID=UPI0029583556|nr:uncharacterized protein LOC132704907 [Cylas formicarius]